MKITQLTEAIKYLLAYEHIDFPRRAKMPEGTKHYQAGAFSNENPPIERYVFPDGSAIVGRKNKYKLGLPDDFCEKQPYIQATAFNTLHATRFLTVEEYEYYNVKPVANHFIL